MTAASIQTVPSLDLVRFTPRDGALWTLAAATVISMHVAAAYAVQSLRPLEEDGGAPPALMIELAPVPMASPIAAQGDIVEAEPAELASAAETVETLDEVEPDVAAETIELPLEAVEPESAAVDTVAAETLAAEDTPATNPLAPAEPVRHAALAPVEEVVPDEVESESAKVEETIPDVVEAVTPEVDVPLPQPRPKTDTVAEVKAEKKVEARAKKPAAEARAAPRKEAPAPSQSAAAAKADTASPKAAARNKVDTVAAPKVSPARWQSRVLSWLNRHKRYPAAAKSRKQEGFVQVAFTVDKGGRITSARVARSSGVPALDQAALDMVRRASPVPAPPPEIATSSMKLAVPVDFSLR